MVAVKQAPAGAVTVPAQRRASRINSPYDNPATRAEQAPQSEDLAMAADTTSPWQERALCGESDSEAFFPEKGDSLRPAKSVCGRCEVRAECLDYALRHDERFGVWGGLSERERRRLKRRSAAHAASHAMAY